jgi:hypothetical protein
MTAPAFGKGKLAILRLIKGKEACGGCGRGSGVWRSRSATTGDAAPMQGCGKIFQRIKSASSRTLQRPARRKGSPHDVIGGPIAGLTQPTSGSLRPRAQLQARRSRSAPVEPHPEPAEAGSRPSCHVRLGERCRNGCRRCRSQSLGPAPEVTLGESRGFFTIWVLGIEPWQPRRFTTGDASLSQRLTQPEDLGDRGWLRRRAGSHTQSLNPEQGSHADGVEPDVRRSPIQRGPGRPPMRP